MTMRLYKTQKSKLLPSYAWKDIVSLVEKTKPDLEENVTRLSWSPPAEGEEAFLLVWSGRFFQERDGGMRFSVTGQHTGLMVDGRLELPMGEGGREADIYAKAGVHTITVVSIVSAGSPFPQLRSTMKRPTSPVNTMPTPVACRIPSRKIPRNSRRP